MSTANTTFSFAPQSGRAPNNDRAPLSRVLATVGVFFSTLADSLTAAHRYKLLTAGGMQPADAARKVFDENFDRR